MEIDFFFMAWAVVEANPRVGKSEFPWLARGGERGELQGRPRACPSPTRCACARPSISGARARARARASENEETLATHPDPRQRKNPDPTQRSRRVTDVTTRPDPTRFQARTMKLRANRILCVGVLVLLGLVLLSTQVQAESENFEPEPTRVLQGEQDPVEDYVMPPPWLVATALGRRSLLRHRDEPRFCCRAFSAQCLACDAGMSVREFCKKRRNKDISGCEKYHRGHGHGDKGRGGRGGRWGGRRWWG